MWAEKKFVVEINEKYVDQKNHQMVTYRYIIGKAYDKKYTSFFRQNIKKVVGRSSQKNIVLSQR